tara:strand:+ start:2594 stop:3043 length:450 start_codon:yes stop_codon:yes gene_type:complete
MGKNKDNAFFKVVELLSKYGFEPSSLRINSDLEFVTSSTTELRNNLTNRKLGSDINFFTKKKKKYIIRQMHQDKSGSSWMKIDSLAKELLEWKSQLKQDSALFFLTGEYLGSDEILDYCYKLEKELKTVGKIYITNEQLLKKLLQEGRL